MTNVVPISCYIRAKNEARKIADVVRAVRPVVDEVVLVDSGSTDDTVALAEAEGARVVHQAWLGYGAQKRFAEEQCRNDWLLSLDADEVISPAFAAELNALFAASEPPSGRARYRGGLLMGPWTLFRRVQSIKSPS